MTLASVPIAFEWQNGQASGRCAGFSADIEFMYTLRIDDRIAGRSAVDCRGGMLRKALRAPLHRSERRAPI
jgi:hypothetical protein